MFGVINLMFPIIFLVVMAMVVYSFVSSFCTWNKNNNSPRLTVPAKIVAKR